MVIHNLNFTNPKSRNSLVPLLSFKLCVTFPTCFKNTKQWQTKYKNIQTHQIINVNRCGLQITPSLKHNTTFHYCFELFQEFFWCCHYKKIGNVSVKLWHLETTKTSSSQCFDYTYTRWYHASHNGTSLILGWILLSWKRCSNVQEMIGWKNPSNGNLCDNLNGWTSTHIGIMVKTPIPFFNLPLNSKNNLYVWIFIAYKSYLIKNTWVLWQGLWDMQKLPMLKLNAMNTCFWTQLKWPFTPSFNNEYLNDHYYCIIIMDKDSHIIP